MVLTALQRRLTYFPSAGPVPSARRVLDGGRDVTLETADGLDLGAWLVPANGDSVTVLVANGNGGDRAGRAPLARALVRRGMGVLLFDYRGFGGNPGTPSEQGLALDIRAARRHLVEHAGVSSERLLYFGESLGSAVATELATEHAPAGMVLRSPFVDLASAGRHHYPYLPVRLLAHDRYPLADNLLRVRAPVLVVYGTADTVVPVEQSRAVADTAPRLHARLEVEGADHNDPALLNGRRLVAAVADLARAVTTP